ncbi:MAG: hypothetical protein PHH08_03065 [Candidatus ainarchaeum sp.]|nr:hypothetical protein [Candidatus ainarchaeum sp.]
MIPKNESGQAFDVFRLLIGAIIGLAILVIIISIIQYLESWKVDVSKKLLADGLYNAVQTPNGEVVVRKDLTLRKGDIFSRGNFAEQSGVKWDCLELLVSNIGAFELRNDSIIEIKQGILTTVYFQCFKKPASNPDCDPYCLVSFGKALKNPAAAP